MRRALETPKKADVHDSMDFVISENSLRRTLTRTSGKRQMEIRFANYLGCEFTGMPRPGVTYYPVLAVFLLGEEQRYKTFDDYLLHSGNTTLIYPVERQSKRSVRRALLEEAIPAGNAWLETFRANRQEAAGYYVMHDRTFHELVFGPHRIAGFCFDWRGKFFKKSQSVVSLERHIPITG